uniref:Uncharacterized protein n=1 Tax=Setaria digitata TaxID=48799 RepID=A0A915PP36_9BILA
MAAAGTAIPLRSFIGPSVRPDLSCPVPSVLSCPVSSGPNFVDVSLHLYYLHVGAGLALSTAKCLYVTFSFDPLVRVVRGERSDVGRTVAVVKGDGGSDKLVVMVTNVSNVDADIDDDNDDVMILMMIASSELVLRLSFEHELGTRVDCVPPYHPLSCPPYRIVPYHTISYRSVPYTVLDTIVPVIEKRSPDAAIIIPTI